MRELGWTEADVIELDVDNLEATARGIALNRTAELAGWDEGALAAVLKALQAEDALDGVGFTEDDVAGLLRALASRLHHDDYQVSPRHQKFIAENKAGWAQVRVFDSWNGR